MRVLVISSELIGAALCHRLIREDHEVKLFIEDEGCRQSLEGIVPKTYNWKNELDWVKKDGLIVFDDVRYGKVQDELRQSGYRVVGGCEATDRTELDRSYFQELLAKYDIPILSTYRFDDCDKAIEFIEADPGPWVVKQNTHLGVLNHVGESKDGSDSIQVLKNYKRYGLKPSLQKRVYGIEVAVGGYFNGNNWVGPININHEHKRLCNDDVGPLTPEMGTVVKFTDKPTPLYRETLEKFIPFLKEIGHKGYFDINFIVNQNNIYPLEATARFGTPIIALHVEMLKSPLIDFLSALADGNNYQPVFSKGYGVIVSVAVPPFPYLKKEISNDSHLPQTIEIMFNNGFEASDFDHIYFEEVSKIGTDKSNDQQKYVWAGDNGWVMHVAGEAKTISVAREKVYNLIDKIILPRKFYRTDIGNRVQNRDLSLLKTWGLI